MFNPDSYPKDIPPGYLFISNFMHIDNNVVMSAERCTKLITMMFNIPAEDVLVLKANIPTLSEIAYVGFVDEKHKELVDNWNAVKELQLKKHEEMSRKIDELKKMVTPANVSEFVQTIGKGLESEENLEQIINELMMKFGKFKEC